MLSNVEAEQRAIDAVVGYELQHGRKASDVRRSRLGYDLISGGRKIEVKASNGGELFKGFVIEGRQFELFADPDFWFYRVLHVSNDAEVVPIRPEELVLSAPQVRFNATGWKQPGRSRLSRWMQIVAASKKGDTGTIMDLGIPKSQAELLIEEARRLSG